MPTSTTRRLILAAAVLAPVLAAAPAQAEFAPYATVAPMKVKEGAAATVKVTLGCSSGNTPCRFTFSSKSRDIVAKRKLVRVSGGTVKVVSWKVRTKADGVCVPNRKALLSVSAQRGGGSSYYAGSGAVTLTDRGDCQVIIGPDLKPTPAPVPVPAPAPAPAPQQQLAPQPSLVPQDSGSPTARITNLGDELDGECATPMWTGQLGAAGADGYFNSGCVIAVKCPPATRVCQADAKSTIDTERYTGRRVTLNSRLHAISGGGVDYWHRDTSCAGQDTCSASDTIMLRGGETASVECNGVRQNAETNRSKITCDLNLKLDPQG
jgi:hypothetical protein